MTKNTWQKLADSFSEGMFQLSLPTLVYTQLNQWYVAYKLTVANYNRQANFEHDLLLFHCSSTHSITHSSRSQYAHQHIALPTLPDRSMPPMEAYTTYQGCLPSCELHSRSLAVGRSWDCAHMLRNPEIAYTISGFWECATQSQDNLCNAISR